MSGFMNPAEFANIRQSEEDFWWYRGMRAILFRMLEPYLAGRRIGPRARGRLRHRLPLAPSAARARLAHRAAGLSAATGLRYARELGVGNPVQGDIRSLPFADGAFDLVMSLDVIAHLPPGEEHLAARELARVARRGGLVVVRTSALDILRSRHGEFAFERQRFTRRRLMGLFAGAGIRVLRCTYLNSLLHADSAGQVPRLGTAVAQTAGKRRAARGALAGSTSVRTAGHGSGVARRG